MGNSQGLLFITLTGGEKMAAEKEITETKRMPMIAMRGIVLFPNMILHFDVGRKNPLQRLKRL